MIEEFERHLRGTNLSENTISSYLFAIRQYSSQYDGITKKNLRAYKVWLIENYKPKTVNLRLRAINCYLESIWIPEDNLDLRVRRDHVPYDVWERQGYLQTTEGNVVHYGYIEKFIEQLGEKYNIREIAFDRWGAVQMVQNLEGMGFTVVPFGQGFKDMSPPTKELMKLVLEQRIAHGGHPVLRWMMDNIFIRTDPAGNIKPDKEKSTEKIDGAVATIMALDRAIRCGNDNGESVYDQRGLLFI